MKINISRRKFLYISGSAAAVIGLATVPFILKENSLSGKSNNEEEWAPQIQPLHPGQTFDLTATLPKSVRRGGIFSVDPHGAALPAQVQLLPQGLLIASNAANASNQSIDVKGVIFTYEEPNGI